MVLAIPIFMNGVNFNGDVKDMNKRFLLRKLPSIDEVLKTPRLITMLGRFKREYVVAWTGDVIDSLRKEIIDGKIPEQIERADFKKIIQERLDSFVQYFDRLGVRRLINATGVVIHTNLGRAPVAIEILERMKNTLKGYTNLEFDVESGCRGHRDKDVSNILKLLLPCEDATIVNNNAGAVFLILDTLANGGEVIVSRGELVEIGGSFRIPEIMERSGAILKEVGTTNKTRVEDYQKAVSENTKLILHVHRSNFEMIGFTQSPSVDELVQLSRETRIPLVVDAGSGYLFDHFSLPIGGEPIIKDLLEKGADIVCFSGDKLLGGAQAGIILGKKNLVKEIRHNPLMRVLRLDKFILYVLSETLKIYFEEGILERLPLFKMISDDAISVKKRCQRLKHCLVKKFPKLATALSIEKTEAVIGGGSTPGKVVSSFALVVSGHKGKIVSMERFLRNFRIPVIGRITENKLYLDLRTVFPSEDSELCNALLECGENQLFP